MDVRCKFPYHLDFRSYTKFQSVTQGCIWFIVSEHSLQMAWEGSEVLSKLPPFQPFDYAMSHNSNIIFPMLITLVSAVVEPGVDPLFLLAEFSIHNAGSQFPVVL